MPNFSTSSDRLQVRPVQQNELPPIKRMGRGPSFDYLSYENGPRQMATRANAVGGAASLFRMGMEALNERSLGVWLRKWLQNNEATITQKMQQHGHAAFVLQVNYAVSDSFETRQFMARDIYLLGTVPSTKDAGQILTAEKLYGPSVDAIPNRGTRFQYAYLVGEYR